MDEMTSFFQGWFDKLRFANKAAHQLYQLTDEELKELDMYRWEIPCVSHKAALEND
jgi:hypothetical protein